MNSFETIADKGPFKFIISTRIGGVSTRPYGSLNLGLNTADDSESVKKNRSDFINSLGLDISDLVYANQIHSAHIEEVRSPGNYENTDGFFSFSNSLVLSITIADCFPVFLGDPESGAYALLHMGWRGTVSGILPRAMNIFEEKKIKTNSLIFAIGPGISAEFFEVGPEVKQKFSSDFWTGYPDNKGYLDLGAAIIDQFYSLGGKQSMVIDKRECTYIKKDKYYSHRRDNGVTGRMLALAWKKN